MKSKWPYVLIAFVLALSAAIQGCGVFGLGSTFVLNVVQHDLTCQNPGPHYTVQVGGRVEIQNPCGGPWVVKDTFITGPCNLAPFLQRAVNGISPKAETDSTTAVPTEKMFLVTDATTQPVVDLELCYIHNVDQGGNEVGVGHGSLFVTVPGALATHFFVFAPAAATAGTPFSFSVTALDQANHPTTSYTGTVHFRSTDLQAVLPADSKLTNGTGTFSATLNTAGSQTITATDTVNGSITGTSGQITVTSFFTLTGHVTGTSNAIQVQSPLAPVGFFCNASSLSCTTQYSSGTTVRISEISLTPVTWTGCDSVGPLSSTIPLSTCTVLMNKDRTVTAAF